MMLPGDGQTMRVISPRPANSLILLTLFPWFGGIQVRNAVQFIHHLLQLCRNSRVVTFEKRQRAVLQIEPTLRQLPVSFVEV